MADEWLEKAVAGVRRREKGKRRAEVNRLLAPVLSEDELTTSAGRELLRRRALLITTLRLRGIYP